MTSTNLSLLIAFGLILSAFLQCANATGSPKGSHSPKHAAAGSSSAAAAGHTLSEPVKQYIIKETLSDVTLHMCGPRNHEGGIRDFAAFQEACIDATRAELEKQVAEDDEREAKIKAGEEVGRGNRSHDAGFARAALKVSEAEFDALLKTDKKAQKKIKDAFNKQNKAGHGEGSHH